jgi:hypothetical protein
MKSAPQFNLVTACPRLQLGEVGIFGGGADGASFAFGAGAGMGETASVAGDGGGGEGGVFGEAGPGSGGNAARSALRSKKAADDCWRIAQEGGGK